MASAPPAESAKSLPEKNVRPPMTFVDRALASVAGSITTSFLMTPLDVIKTRLQTQWEGATRPAPTGSLAAFMDEPKGPPCPVHGTQPHAVPKSVLLQWIRPASSTASYSMPTSVQHSSMCIYPDKCSTARMCEAGVLYEGRMNGIWDGLVKVARAEGWRSLWRGLLPTVAMTVPSQVTYMTCYDVFRKSLLSIEAPVPTLNPSRRSDSSPPVLLLIDSTCDMPCERSEPVLPVTLQHKKIPLLIVSLISGALARSISATLVTPLELLRTRLQASHGRSSSLSVIRPLIEEVQTHGASVLWCGLSATLWRDVPFSAIYFTGYEAGKVLLTGGGFGESQTSTLWHEFGSSFIVGAVSGSIAAMCTHPFDLVKTRLQAEHVQAGTSSNSLFRALRQITTRDGPKGLFRGLSPRLAKVAPACGIMIGAFEGVSRLLAHSRAN
ncbi:Carrier protein, mitochondrial [Malassezia equina]|uniref:Carrier protein, mitochondrial n=1 Tax=Malassezia equina TaxID=1381935 RepID=A0AAF0EFW2_9BASI|nr:Carrier protein, mitochondrial [Malassezia equina]